MSSMSIIEALSAVEAEFIVDTNCRDDLIDECLRIRYQVYCVEHDFLQGAAGLETDEFDKNSKHVALLSRLTGDVVGTVRMVMPAPRATRHDFPLTHVCDPSLLDAIPVQHTAEISRFAISKTRRSFKTSALMRMGLVQGLVRLSRENDITHWCAVMEPCLLRLLRMTAIHFLPVGDLVDYHGVRQPCYNKLDTILGGVAAGRPDVWNYLTDNGRLGDNGRLENTAERQSLAA